MITLLSQEEDKIRKDRNISLFDFNDDFFNDWYKVLYCFNTRKPVVFKNDIMNELYSKYMTYDKRKH